MTIEDPTQARSDHTDGYGQVCAPPSTHGQTLQLSEPHGSLRMVDTSDYDHGNLNSGLCVVQTPTLEGAQAESTIVQSPTLTNHDAEPLTLDVQHDGDETTSKSRNAGNYQLWDAL